MTTIDIKMQLSEMEEAMTDKPKPTSVRIPESLKKKVEAKAKKEGRSFNNMVNRILTESLV